MYPNLCFLAVIMLSLSPSRGVNGECGAVKRDLAILLDASGSVGVDNFQLAKDFVRDLLQQLPIGPDAVKVSLLTFATQTKVFCWLEDSVSREAVLVKLDNVTYDQRATLTHLALQTVHDQVLTPQRGARPEVADMVVVITDGKSNAPNRTLEAVQRLHQEGVAVVAIGVGGGVDEGEVRAMASHPQLAFLVESYARLASLHQQLFLSACDEKFVEVKTTMGSSPTTEMSTTTVSMKETTTPTTSAIATTELTSTRAAEVQRVSAGNPIICEIAPTPACRLQRQKKNKTARDLHGSSWSTSERNAADLIIEELELVKLEKEKVLLKISLLKLQNTNAKLQQNKLLYEMRQLGIRHELKP